MCVAVARRIGDGYDNFMQYCTAFLRRSIASELWAIWVAENDDHEIVSHIYLQIEWGAHLTINILAQKGDQRPHLEWKSNLLIENEQMYLCLSWPGTACRHHTKGIEFMQSHFCLSLFPKELWYNAMFDYDLSGQLIGIYCNVSRPPQRKENTIEWVDLDLDIISNQAGHGEIVDKDEFEVNSLRYSYPQDAVDRAKSVAASLKERVSRQDEPFDWIPLQEMLARYGLGGMDLSSRLA